MRRLDNRSRMSGDVHVRFCESPRGKVPRATRQKVVLVMDNLNTHNTASLYTAFQKIYVKEKL